MSFWIICLLCIIQGLTEFLPVSSSGHLTLIEQLFGIKDNLLLINLFLHLATLVAVIIVYRKTIWKLLKKPFQPLTYKLVISTIFTCIIALIFEYFSLEDFSFKIYCFGFLLTSVLLFLMDKYKNQIVSIKNGVSYKDSIIVGVVQGIAVIPGLSRSGSTIATLGFCGNNAEESGEYSFLLSIPVIVGGFVLEIVKMCKNQIIPDVFTFKTCVFAFFLTLIVAIISLKITLKILKKNKFIYFSIYTFILFIVTFVLNYVI
ncbi:MAG: undecaprenyl-diphosphate phosphatase [Clostridiales bacterium]|nr:undecaprenyl-diphosphate phosphatase [Clostridiales bacterium]